MLMADEFQVLELQLTRGNAIQDGNLCKELLRGTEKDQNFRTMYIHKSILRFYQQRSKPSYIDGWMCSSSKISYQSVIH